MLCLGSSASPWFTPSCCRDGSLAVIQPLWVQQTAEVPWLFGGVATAHTCAHPTSNAQGRHCNIAHPSQSSSYGSAHPHFAGDVHASVRASGIEKEGYCPTACATFPVLVDRDRSFQNLSIYQNWIPRRVSPCVSALASMGQQALSPPKVWISGKADLVFRSPCSGEVQNSKRPQRHDHVRNMSQWDQHRSGARFQNSSRSAKTRSVAPLSLFSAPSQIWNTFATCRGVVDKATASPAARKRMTGKYILDVFGVSGFLPEATNHLSLRGNVLVTKFDLPDFDLTFPMENVSQK